MTELKAETGKWSGLKRRREYRHCTLVEAEDEERFILRYEGVVEERRLWWVTWWN